MHACAVPSSTLMSQLADFHNSWYKTYAIRGHSYCNTFISPAVSYNMNIMQNYEVRTILPSLNLGFVASSLY